MTRRVCIKYNRLEGARLVHCVRGWFREISERLVKQSCVPFTREVFVPATLVNLSAQTTSPVGGSGRQIEIKFLKIISWDRVRAGDVTCYWSILHQCFSDLKVCAFWLTTECRSRAYAILICLSSSSSSSSSLLLLLLSVSTPPDHMLGQIRFILCMHMQLYPV